MSPRCRYTSVLHADGVRDVAGEADGGAGGKEPNGQTNELLLGMNTMGQIGRQFTQKVSPLSS
jgi:hypothetical protein